MALLRVEVLRCLHTLGFLRTVTVQDERHTESAAVNTVTDSEHGLHTSNLDETEPLLLRSVCGRQLGFLALLIPAPTYVPTEWLHMQVDAMRT